jgi:glucose/arabinose dehydrogenase
MSSTNTLSWASPSRRQLLKYAVGLPLLGASGTANAQQTSAFELDGKITGWVGQSPDAIADQTNPTLTLTPGRQYEITWTNVDGRAHNIVVIDGDGNTLERTEIISEQGATQTLTFTATTEMAEYFCEVHPNSMRGELRIDGTTSTTTTTPTPEENSSNRFMPAGATVRLETIAEGGMTAPTALEIPPSDDDRRFIADQVGQVYILGSSGLEPFIDISDQLVDFDNLPSDKTIDERGLLGLTFHPEFRDNQKFYLHYSAPPRSGTPDGYTHTQVLSEFRATEDFSAGDPDSERTVLEIPSPYYTHNAGDIVFGPDDGYLYMGMGNGGGDLQTTGNVDDWYKNRGGNGQDVTENLLGSILRIDVDTQEDGKPYAIPDDNPLVGREGLDEQFAWGFRNPWRMTFDRGNLFVCDVGQFEYEEVNIVAKGNNYGWNVKEGSHCFASGGVGEITECPDRTPPDVRGGEPLIDPIIEYPHNYEGESVGSAVTGGTIYENATIPALRGKFVFGDYSKSAGQPSGSVFAATPPQEGQWPLEEVRFEGDENDTLDSYVLGVHPDGRGELYVLTTDNLGVRGETGAVHKINPPSTETTTPAATATPEHPPTATPTPTPTPTPTSETSTTTDVVADTTRSRTTATNTGESEGWISQVDGPGFSIAAALAALGGIAIRSLSQRE